MAEAITDELYATAATAKGGREGTVKSADGVIDLPLGKPGSTSNPKANPETLFAAGYASCFSGALAAVAGKEGLDVSESTVTANVHFGKTDSGFGLAVDISADIPGVDAAKAQELVEAAHQLCPYSKATRGNIEVNVSVA
ncbi:Ohr subfamily peroxiredoxin [Barrientosiimonas humi]|uniref:Ohr subfamily peroxiredoxin n=2 Tax=Barrientosiimonas TaxID=1535207 RepID=A0A542X8W7_9MICO|nr:MULTISPECIES: organic hydroperoxide resistance protein [Barrientosiimonas]TQL32278.1 Ohr subfamily peroxiredoxin [Barrientosiimonas humi]BDZ57018.1 organic hydroperoxide resistance protein [Barrientosiimonas endolithica]CAG7572266.1 Organic hydroperoxide resistance protein OhrB [Barrientosiimonas humi]